MDILFNESFEEFEYDAIYEETNCVEKEEECPEKSAASIDMCMDKDVAEKAVDEEKNPPCFSSRVVVVVEVVAETRHGIQRTSGIVKPLYFHTPTTPSIATIRNLEIQMSLPAAAASLGISSVELRRICRSFGINRWNHREHMSVKGTNRYLVNLRKRHGI